MYKVYIFNVTWLMTDRHLSLISQDKKVDGPSKVDGIEQNDRKKNVKWTYNKPTKTISVKKKKKSILHWMI